MTDYVTTLGHYFAEHMEATAQAASELPDLMGHAAEIMVGALLGEGRILACGNGHANTLAQYFCTSLLHRHTHDRPALPAFNLGADATTFAAICKDNRINDTFSRQIRALGHPQDVLLIVVDDGHKSNLIQAIQAAHDRQMRIIALNAHRQSEISALLQPEDIELALPDLPPHRAAEVGLVVLNALCTIVDQMIFGH